MFLSAIYPADPNLFLNCILLWGAMIYVWIPQIVNYLKNPEFTHIIFKHSKTSKPKVTEVMTIVVLFSFSIIIYNLLYSTFKLEYLFTSHIELFGNLGLLSFFIQITYFVVEVLMMTIVVARVQELTSKRKDIIPYGGIFLAFTWGLSHFITGSSLAGSILMDISWVYSDILSSYALITGLYYVIISLLIGAIFIILKRDLCYAFPIIALLYIL